MVEKKIALIRSGYSPFGGIEMHALSLMKHLLAHKVHIHLLTWPDQDWPLEHPNLTIVPIGHHWGSRLYQSWHFNRSVRRYLKNHSFDCVFSMDQVETCTHIHAGGGSHRVFLQIKNQHSPAISRLFRRLSLFHKLILSLERKAFTNSSLKKIRCCSAMVQSDISAHYNVPEEKMIVIHNGIDWSGIGKIFEKRQVIQSELLDKHKLNKEWQFILFLGSGFERKGLDIAIKGLKYIDNNFNLLVIGKGSEKPFNQLARANGVNDRVHFLGPQPNGWQFAAMCKGFVLPSRYEPFGRAAAEVQAMGLPALVSNRTGYAELIQEEETGIILRFPDTDSEIQQSFERFAAIMKTPKLSATQIRNRIEILDDQHVIQLLINEFLGL